LRLFYHIIIIEEMIQTDLNIIIKTITLLFLEHHINNLNIDPMVTCMRGYDLESKFYLAYNTRLMDKNSVATREDHLHYDVRIV